MSQSAQQAQEATWPAPGWITKKEAAKRLKLSEPRIAAMAGDGTLESRKDRNPVSNQLVTLINAVAVDRLGFEREHPEVLAKPNNSENPGLAKIPANLNNPNNKPNKLALLPSESLDNIASYIMPANFDPHCWPAWLTLKQAAMFSGMPKSWLVAFAENAMAHAMTSPVKVRDLGKHAVGGRWRFNRESLEKV